VRISHANISARKKFITKFGKSASRLLPVHTQLVLEIVCASLPFGPHFSIQKPIQADGKSCFDKCTMTASSRNSTRGRHHCITDDCLFFPSSARGLFQIPRPPRSLRRVSCSAVFSAETPPVREREGRPHGCMLRPHCIRPVSRLSLPQSFNTNLCVLFVLTTPNTSFSTLSR